MPAIDLGRVAYEALGLLMAFGLGLIVADEAARICPADPCDPGDDDGGAI